MPRTARATPGGYCFPVRNRGNRRAEVFHDPADDDAFVHLRTQTAARFCVRLLGFCGMASHFHLAAWPGAKSSPSSLLTSIIGQTWVSVSRSDGVRRLDDPADFVRIEIEQALSRRVPLVPALVGNAEIPVPDQLPESMRKLTRRHAISIRPDPDFHRDMDRLIKALNEHRKHEANRSTPRPGSAGTGRAGRIILSALAALSRGSGGKKQEGEGRDPCPEDHDKLPGAVAARRQGDAAALWFLRAGIGILATACGFLALYLGPYKTEDLNLPFFFAIAGVATACHFLASSGLKNFRGRAMVVTAIVFGFVCGLLLACVGIGILRAVVMDPAPDWRSALLISLPALPAAVANFFAAIRGILVLKNASVREEFGRPPNKTEEPRRVFSKNLVIGLACGLAGWFFLVLVVILAERARATR